MLGVALTHVLTLVPMITQMLLLNLTALSRRHLLFSGLTIRTLLLLLVDFLQLHPPVLKPDLNLPLRQAEGVGKLRPPVPCQIHIRLEFFLQFVDLKLGVWSALCTSWCGRECCKQAAR